MAVSTIPKPFGIRGDWDLLVTGTSGQGSLHLNKSLTEYDAILVLIAGTHYMTRFSGIIPTKLFFNYHNQGQQFNAYINNTRLFVTLTYVSQYDFNVETSLDGTYCDRVMIYMI